MSRALVLLALVLATAPAVGGPLQHLEEDWRWSHFGVHHGLPSSDITHLAADDQGRMWVATPRGVAWFDGYRWQPATDLPRAPVEQLAAAPPDPVLVVAGGRLYRGGPQGFRPLPITRGSDTLTVRAAVARGSDLLVLTADSLLRRRPGGAVEVLPSPAAVTQPRRETGQLLGLIDGDPVVHTPDGLRRRTGDAWHPVVPGSTVGAWGHGGGVTVAGVLWPYAPTGLWERQPDRPAGQVEAFAHETIQALAVSPTGEAVAQFQSGRAGLRLDGTWHEVDHHILARATALAFDAAGDLWVGTRSGLHYFRSSSRRWSYWRNPADPQGNRVHEIMRTRAGDVWTATAAGLAVHRAAGGSERISQVLGHPLEVTTGLAQDGAGRIWITSGAASVPGALCLEDSTWRHVDGQGLPRAIHRVEIDRRGRPWFLGLGGEGAAVLDGDRFVRWNHPEGLGGRSVYAFAEAADGTLWFGTDRGLSRWRAGVWRHWTGPEFPFEAVFALAVDDSGRVCFGSRAAGTGVGCMAGSDSLVSVDLPEGLLHEEVWGLATGDGRLWLASTGGLHARTGSGWIHFPPGSGLPNPHVWPLLVTGSKVYAGTQGGGVAILDIDSADGPLPVVDLQRPGVDDRTARLLWQAFAWKGQQSPDEIHTRHRIDDGPWSRWSLQRTATVAGLDHGGHTATVQARDLFGRFDPAGASWDFDVLPPRYMQPAFVGPIGLSLALAVAVGVGLVVNVRRNQLALEVDLGLQAVRNEILRMRTQQDWTRVVDALKEHLPHLVGGLRCGLNLVHADGTCTVYHEVPDEPNPIVTDGIPRPIAVAFQEQRIHYRRSRAEMEAAGDDLPDPRIRCVVDVPFDGGTLAINADHETAFSAADLAVIERFARVMSEAHRRLEDLRALETNEQRLRDARRLELVDRLATGMAHEINNPLTHIVGYAEMLLRQPLEARQHQYVETIRAAGERAAGITARLLQFSRQQRAGTQPLELSGLITTSVELERFALLQRHVEVDMDLDAGVRVVARPGDLQQLLHALLQNAADAMAPTGGGQIHIRLRGGDPVAIDVADDGPGVSSEAAAHIFEPFFTTKENGQGVGLGLSSCRQIAAAHGGTIYLDTAERGARFVVELPAMEARKKDHPTSVPTRDPKELKT